MSDTIEDAMLRHPSSGQLQEIIAGNATRAFNSGVAHENARILQLLEDEKRKCEQAGLFANGYQLREELQTAFIGLEMAIMVIKEEQK